MRLIEMTFSRHNDNSFATAFLLWVALWFCQPLNYTPDVIKLWLASSMRLSWTVTVARGETISQLYSYECILNIKHEVLGRTNRLLPLIDAGHIEKRCVQQFFYCCVCIHYRGNVSTEPLPSNDRGIFTEPLPSNDRGGYTDTQMQRRDLIRLPYFFQNRKVG
jgi:hypothetical protein